MPEPLNPMMRHEEGRVFIGAGRYKTVRENLNLGPHTVYKQGEDLIISRDIADVMAVMEMRRSD